MDLLPPELQDLAVLRRIIFAVAQLPRDLPQYWDVVTQFARQGDKSLQSESVRLAVENLQFINERVFVTDTQLREEIHALRAPHCSSSPLGIVLLSLNKTCKVCGGGIYRFEVTDQATQLYTLCLGALLLAPTITSSAKTIGKVAASDNTMGTAPQVCDPRLLHNCITNSFPS